MAAELNGNCRMPNKRLQRTGIRIFLIDNLPQDAAVAQPLKQTWPTEAVTTPSRYSAHLSFSLGGRRMVYSQLKSRANLQQVGFDPGTQTVTGQPVWITQGSRWTNTPNLSPNGEWLAFDSQGGKQEDLFVIMRDGTSLRQLTDDLHKDRQPRWSPDGRRLAFYSDRTGKWEIWIINSDGAD
jgi:Tol biopolymer transport system component